MNSEVPIPAPLALRHLIESNNELLKKYQFELTNKVILANEEMMQMLGLDPNDGWRLDMGTFTYIKSKETDDSSNS